MFDSGFDGSDFTPWQLGLNRIATEFNGNYSLGFSVYGHPLRWDIMISLSRPRLAGNCLMTVGQKQCYGVSDNIGKDITWWWVGRT